MSIEKEYAVLRNGVGILDMSNLAKIRIQGENSCNWLDEMCTGNIYGMANNKSIYSCFCREDGSIVSLFWLVKDSNSYLLITDYQKKNVTVDWLEQHKKAGVEIADVSNQYSCISIIGPKAIEVAKTIIGEDIIGLSYLAYEHFKIDGNDVLVCRQGHAGEYEYRFLVSNEFKPQLLDKILEAGKPFNISSCGLEVLDTLMLEMKSVNQLKDLMSDTTLAQAGLQWMAQLRKDKFIGMESIKKEIEGNINPKLMLIVIEGEQPVNKDSNVYIGEAKAGTIVNTQYSYTINKQIGLAYINYEFAWVGLEFVVDNSLGNKSTLKTVSAPLFITKTVRTS